MWKTHTHTAGKIINNVKDLLGMYYYTIYDTRHWTVKHSDRKNHRTQCLSLFTFSFIKT